MSATRASRESTGWQATNISASTSSSIGSGSHRTSSVTAGRRRRRASLQVAGERGVPLVEGARAGGRRRSRAGAPPRAASRPGCGARRRAARHERLGERLLGEILGEREVAGVAGERADDAGGLDPPHRLDGLAAARPPVGVSSWPVASRHARSFWIHSLSCGNSSMLGDPADLGLDAGAGHRRPLGPLDGLLLRGDVEDLVAAEQLLRLAVRAVGHDGRLGGVVDDDALRRVVEPSAATSTPAEIISSLNLPIVSRISLKSTSSNAATPRRWRA